MISFQRNASMKKNSFLKHPVARRISHRAGFPNPDERSLRGRDAEVRLRPSRGWSAAPLCPFVEMLLWTASDCSKGSVCQKIRTFCQVGTAEQPRDGPRFSMWQEEFPIEQESQMPTNGSSGSGCFNKKNLCISDSRISRLA